MQATCLLHRVTLATAALPQECIVRGGAAWAHAMPGWLLVQVCTETYGFSADVVCTGNLHTSMPYIPIHCDYMCAAPLVAL